MAKAKPAPSGKSSVKNAKVRAAAPPAKAGGLRNLGIRGIDHVDFVVHDLERSRQFYAKRMDFAETARSGAAYERETGERTAVFDAARVRVQCSVPLEKESGAARFLRLHPDGIRAVTFRVGSVEHAWKTLESRGANFLGEVAGKPGYRQFAIATPLGDVEYRFLEKSGPVVADEAPGDKGNGAVDPRLSPVVSAPRAGGGNRHRFTHMDHVTNNTREMRSYVNWMRDVMGFEHFWDIRFHTRDSNPDMVGGSGLQSIVMWDPTCNVKFATNEPLRPNYYASQINKYVEDNQGAGVQHIAFSTRAIMDVVPAMRKAGLKFLETPDAYYKMLPKRLAERAVDNLKEDIKDLQRNKILVDGRDDRYLLQIFMQEAALLYNEAAAGPFFYEVIQRHGDQGFGEGNFRALFESIERQQAGETQRTVQNPYLMD
ncbi:MAG TPA: VOC family protein [Candidatus Thermoplasmatota archaeon]|nr:VOC family protein [Candidatus Thermoplasmatota archaeon]